MLGGGAIGLELAPTFGRFGTTVSVVEVADRILPAEEPEASRVLADVLTAEGITLRTGAPVQEVAHGGAGFTVRIPGAELTAERVLVATGRTSDLAGLGLAAIGLDTDRRFVEPDEHLRSADGVYVIGNITGRGPSPTCRRTRL